MEISKDHDGKFKKPVTVTMTFDSPELIPKSTNTFRPQRYATRAEAIAVILSDD